MATCCSTAEPMKQRVQCEKELFPLLARMMAYARKPQRMCSDQELDTVNAGRVKQGPPVFHSPSPQLYVIFKGEAGSQA